MFNQEYFEAVKCNATNHYRSIRAIKTQLLSVAERTHDVIIDPDVEENDVRMCGHLHMVAMAALLSRTSNRPTFEECK